MANPNIVVTFYDPWFSWQYSVPGHGMGIVFLLKCPWVGRRQ